MSLATDAFNCLELKILFEVFKHLEYGSFTLAVKGKETRIFKGKASGLDVEMTIHDISCVGVILKQGDIGLGESYMEGKWSTPDLAKLFSFFIQNMSAVEKIIHGNKTFQFIWKISKFLNKNSKKGSKRNIIKHYDLGNDFYSLWLDPSMTYSSALYTPKTKTLEQAQEGKYQRILDQLPDKGARILEIGCGWGGFAEKAAKSGHDVTCLTLSPSQAKYAKDRLARNNLDKKVDIQICDYRDMKDQFNHIVSIEMFEAVGQEYWETYFKSVARCLKPGGTAIIQTITIDDDIFEGYQNRVDFIQKHIFPGGILPSKKIFKDLATKFGFTVEASHDFGHDYAQTLHQWLSNFDAAKQEVVNLGFDESFILKWRFYMAYCIAGFEQSQTDVVQYTLKRS